MSIIVTIDLGDGRKDDLKIGPNTDLIQLTKAFCTKHNLPMQSSEILLNEIKKSAPNLKIDSEPITESTLTQKPPKHQNAGVKLYEKGQRYMEIIANKIQKFKKMREENERKDLTFSPIVNKSKYASSVEILLRSGVQTEQKLEKLRGEKLNNEINCCTFSPKINKKSKGIVMKKRSMTPDKDFSTSFGSSAASSWNIIKLNRSSVHESLYLEARSRSEMRKKSSEIFYQSTFAFKPDLRATNDVSAKLLEKRGKYKRISDYRKELEYYLRVKALNTDLQTGQELFKPKISEYTVGERRYNSPCRMLYDFNTRRNRLTSEKSEKIVKRIWFLRFQTIFNTLCPKDEKISVQGVRKASLDKYMRQLLAPILNRIEAGEIWEFEQFRKEMQDLVTNMTPEDRNFVIKGEKPVQVRPKSVPVSPLTFSIYERNLEKLKATKGKIERLRKKMKQNEVKHCTFAPSTVRYATPKKLPDIWTMETRLNRSLYSSTH